MFKIQFHNFFTIQNKLINKYNVDLFVLENDWSFYISIIIILDYLRSHIVYLYLNHQFDFIYIFLHLIV